jgi:hypothetical protein
MRVLSIIIIVASLIGLSFISKTKTGNKLKEMKQVNGTYSPVTVLELFTSEGCSSCPPADELLPELAKLDSNIIPLSFHVDYWNRLGWTDPFSSSVNSDRQRKYADYWRLESVYTPQLIINGEYEVVGSNKSQAESSIKKALLERSSVKIKIDDVKIIDGKIKFTSHSDGDWKKTDLIAVLVQKNATMKVKAGENRGATLSHTNVVRSLEKQTTENKNEFNLVFPKNLANNNWQLIVYSQHSNNLKITGAASYNPL